MIPTAIVRAVAISPLRSGGVTAAARATGPRALSLPVALKAGDRAEVAHGHGAHEHDEVGCAPEQTARAPAQVDAAGGALTEEKLRSAAVRRL